jgi:hypothetical protein
MVTDVGEEPVRTPAPDPRKPVNNDRRRRHLRALPDLESADRFETVRTIGGGTPGNGIPRSVREDMEQAAELWESLRADGKQLRYEVNPDSGHVSVELCDLEGARLRAVPLVEALGSGDDGTSAA